MTHVSHAVDLFISQNGHSQWNFLKLILIVDTIYQSPCDLAFTAAIRMEDFKFFEMKISTWRFQIKLL